MGLKKKASRLNHQPSSCLNCWPPEVSGRKESLRGQKKKDIRLGFSIAREIGRLDIGQSVIVGGGSILAVEAIDGTDATIQRGGRLGRGEAVLVKVCKPNQDFRFDVPSVGVKTIETMIQFEVRALAIEAERTVVFDRSEMIGMANANDIVIVCE